MPIGKVICSSSFAATARYVLVKEQARVIGGTMLGQTPDEMVWEFEQSRRLNLDINRPCLHLILSYSREDERLKTLDDDLLEEISQEHFAGCAVLSRWHKPLQELDKNEYRRQVEAFKESEIYHYQFFAAIHEDVHHRHTHLVGSRINTLDGKCLETWQNRIKSQYVIRDIEERYGLEINQSSWEKERRGLTRRQLEKWQETGIKPLQLELQENIDEAIAQVETIEELIERLHESGINTQLHQQRGQIYGISYAKNGVAFRGSQLGKKYTIQGLERTFEELEIHARQLKRDINRGINVIDGRETGTHRATTISEYPSTPQAIAGLRKLRKRRRTRQITAGIGELGSTLDHLESSLRNSQRLTSRIVDLVQELERQQEQVRQKQARLDKNRQKTKDKGWER